MHFYALEGGIKIKHKKIILTLAILFVILLAASTVSAADNITDKVVGVDDETDSLIEHVEDKDDINYDCNLIDDENLLKSSNSEIISSNGTKTPVTIVASDEMETGGIVTLKDTNNNVIPYTNLSFQICTPDPDEYIIVKSAIVSTDENGSVKIPADNVSVGIYKVRIYFAGDEQYKSSSRIVKLTIYDNVLNDDKNDTLIILNGTFADLTQKIENTNDELILTRNYTYSLNDSEFIRGISINKKIIIDGNGFAIIGNNCASALKISFNNVTLKNIKFVNCSSNSFGGAVYWSGQYGTLVNCSFVNCSSTSYGGAVFWGSWYGTLVNCSFVNCSSNSYGGAICCDNSYDTISGCYFANCSSNVGGGAIYWDVKNGTIIKSTFINNNAIKGKNVYIETRFGATGLYQEDLKRDNFINEGIFTNINAITSKVDLNLITFSIYDVKNDKLNITFKNGTNYSIDIINGTASLSLPYGTYEFNASYNSQNYSSVNTGYKKYLLEDSLYGLLDDINDYEIVNLYRDFDVYKGLLIDANNIIIDGKGFKLNFNTSEPLWFTGSNIVLKNIVFVISNATNQQGLVYGTNSPSIINCTFINNGSDDCRFIKSFGNLHVTNCTFANNKANFTGGCIYSYTSEGTSSYIWIDNCTFINCSSLRAGGAIYSFCNVNINQCTFINCVANEGGAIFLQTANFGINRATVSESTFINCSANKGGAIALNDMRGSITYNNFINTTNSSNNGIYMETSSDIYLKNNWWGSNAGFKKEYVTVERDGVNVEYGSIIDEWLILNTTVTPINNSNDKLALISTYFMSYNNLTGLSVNLTSNHIRPAKYELSNGFVSVNSTGDVIFDCNKVGYYPVSINITVDNQIISKTFYVFKKVTPLVNVSISDCVENKSKIFMIKTTNDLTNDFNITIAGKNGYIQTISNIVLNGGSYTKEFKNLLPSNYTIYVKYGGDEGYYPIEKNITFKVTKFDPSYSVNVTNALFKQNATIVVSIPITGNVTINIGNITIFDNIVIDNGKVVKNVSNLDAGNYLIEITYNGNEYYNTLTQFVNLTIAKASSAIKVYVNDSKYGEDTIINVTSDITCQLFVKINNTIKDINVTANELQSINFGKLNASNYTVIVSFDGDKNYNNASLTKEFNVSKINASLIIQKEDVNVDETVNISILLPNDATGSVKVTLGNNETIIPITNPIVYWKFTPTKGGNHTVKVEYLGDNNYFTNKTNFTLIVKKLNPTISCNGTEVIVPNEPYQITVNLPDDATGKVIINLDKNNYTIENITTAKTITIPKINEGSYNCTIYYSGDDKYNSYNDTRQILVNINRNVKISASDITTTNKNGKFELTLLDAKNNPLSSELIIVYIDTDEYDVTTNKNGTATVYYGLNSGEHKVNVYFNSTDTYNPLKTTFKITIKSEINNDQITIPSLSSGSGAVKLPSDAKGTITLDIAGKKYDFPVVNGVANIKLPDLANGNYGYVLTYSGDAKYTSFTKTGSMAINNIVPTTLICSAVTTVYNGGKYLVATLKDINGKPIVGVQVTINLNGVKYQTTDKNGQVKLSTNGLAPKTYTATITFAGNANYAKSTKYVKVTVKKATPKLTAGAKTFKKSVKTKKYTVTLKTNQNKVMKNTKVYLKVNKKTYTAKTNSKGVATFKITKLTKKGKYTAAVTYSGSSYYNKVTKNVKITIK